MATMGEHDLGFLENVARSLGSNTVVLRLLVSLLLGYPLALLYRTVFHGKPATVQHIFFIICGVALGYFNFGEGVLHSAANITLIYILLAVIPGSKLSVILAFIINVTYLVVGYYYMLTKSGEEHRLGWTTPHCVLTLRLTGLVWDVYDGRRKPESLSAEQKETALPHAPNLLEIAAHSYFFGGFLVGPQFPMKRYLNFVEGAFDDKVTGGPPTCVGPALTRLFAGISYITAFQLTNIFIPDTYLLSENFESHSLLVRLLLITLWGKLMLNKYLGVWLMTEGTCILTGLTYNGKDENGNDLWDGCANIHIQEYESASTCSQLIASFNVNTNKWMGKYIFKRLKFMGSKEISQSTTLFFLALWHGLESGYYVNFAMEFFIMKFEKDVGTILNPLSAVRSLGSMPGGAAVLWFMKKLYAQFALSYALVSFSLLMYPSYLKVYASVYFLGHIVFCGWSAIQPFLAKPRSSPRQPAPDSSEKKSQ